MAPCRGSTPGHHTPSASLGTNRINLLTGRSNCLTGPFLLPSAGRAASPRSTWTEQLYPSLEGYVFDTRASCQQFFGRVFSFTITMSATHRFLRGWFHLMHCWRLKRNFFLQRHQNSLARCWTLLHRFRHQESGTY